MFLVLFSSKILAKFNIKNSFAKAPNTCQTPMSRKFLPNLRQRSDWCVLILKTSLTPQKRAGVSLEGLEMQGGFPPVLALECWIVVMTLGRMPCSSEQLQVLGNLPCDKHCHENCFPGTSKLESKKLHQKNR